MTEVKDIPMRVVKEKTGLTSRQIRYYDETGLIFPDRTKGNQRLFSTEDINKILQIKKLLEEGYTIEAIKKKLTQPEPIKKKNLLDNEINRMSKGQLSSLYPVSNRQYLNKILEEKKKNK